VLSFVITRLIVGIPGGRSGALVHTSWKTCVHYLSTIFIDNILGAVFVHSINGLSSRTIFFGCFRRLCLQTVFVGYLCRLSLYKLSV